jgi:hypothetical protein
MPASHPDARLARCAVASTSPAPTAAKRVCSFACSAILTAAIAVPPISAVQMGHCKSPAQAVAMQKM